MDRWADFGNQIDSAFGGNAPRPAQAGTGAGNRPYAPGIMSGQYGASPEAQQMYRQMDAGMQGQQAGAQMGPAMATPGQNPAPPPQQQQQFNPMMQAQILDYLMKMMQQRAQSGQKATISTGGIY